MSDTSSISGNHVVDPVDGDGGGVFNAGDLTLKDTSSISGNEAGWGGGVYNSGTLTLEDRPSIRNNKANSLRGGGVSNYGTLLMSRDSSISGNYGCGVVNKVYVGTLIGADYDEKGGDDNIYDNTQYQVFNR